MVATFHNHTTWSDGLTGPAEMCAAAESQAVGMLGFSDHFCILPGGVTEQYALAPDRVPEYLDCLLALRGQFRTEIVAGLEFDWFDGTGELIAPFAETPKLDYSIGAVHYVRGDGFDIDASFWSAKSGDERDAAFAEYWRLVRQMAQSGLFDIAAHLDLPKKFGFCPRADMRPLEDAALDAIRESGMVVELNTAGYRCPCGEGYPSPALLKRCRQREIPVTLSSDAHRPQHLLHDFARGANVLREAGYTDLTRFRAREKWSESLDSAIPKQY